MASIVKGWESHKISHRTAQDIFRAVLQEFIPSIGLADPTDESAKTRISSTYIPSTLLDSEGITQLLRQLTSLDLGPQAHQLLDKLEKLAKDEEPAIVFRGFFLPFAKNCPEHRRPTKTRTRWYKRSRAGHNSSWKT
jgi:hypothetical protein